MSKKTPIAGAKVSSTGRSYHTAGKSKPMPSHAVSAMRAAGKPGLKTGRRAK
jgi:hypothetical protein